MKSMVILITLSALSFNASAWWLNVLFPNKAPNVSSEDVEVDGTENSGNPELLQSCEDLIPRLKTVNGESASQQCLRLEGYIKQACEHLTKKITSDSTVNPSFSIRPVYDRKSNVQTGTIVEKMGGQSGDIVFNFRTCKLREFNLR